MPKMNGQGLAVRVRAIHPGIRTILASGYTEVQIDETEFAFLAKPFTAAQPAAKARDVLEQTGAPSRE